MNVLIMSVNKSHLLDPLNTIFKLALLNISEPDSRLSVNGYIVTLQQPGKYMGLGLSRFMASDNKNDLYLLLRSIKKIIEWYTTEYLTDELIIPVHNPDPEVKQELPLNNDENKNIDVKNKKKNKNKHAKDDNLIIKENLVVPPGKTRSKSENVRAIEDNEKKIIDNDEKKNIEGDEKKIKKKENKFYKNQTLYYLMLYACQGLERLQKSYLEKYTDNSVIIVLQFMINLLRDGMEGKLDLNKLPMNYRNSDPISLIRIQEILNMWKDSEIERMLKLLHDSKKYIYDHTNSGLISVEDILVNEGNRTILNGYMKTILDSLTILDEKFKKIVERSFS